MDHKDILELMFWTNALAKSSNPDEGPIRDRIEEYFEKGYGGGTLTYLFSIQTPSGSWDVFDVQRGQMGSYKMAQDPKTTGVAGYPAEFLRDLMILPWTGDEAALNVMMGLPRWRRRIQVGTLLVDDDRYRPLSASYYGEPPEEGEEAIQSVIRRALEVLSTDEFRGSLSQPSPSLPAWFDDLLERVSSVPVLPHERDEVLDPLMRLDDQAFLEALSRIIPRMDAANPWMNTDPRLARRAHSIKESQPRLKGRIPILPWKDAFMYPDGHKAMLSFETPERTASVRMNSL